MNKIYHLLNTRETFGRLINASNLHAFVEQMSPRFKESDKLKVLL